ncbi:hypothetical protein LZG04_27485 [Saccharothrix sp. S26]|uniref:hypothetical protein n=1 Tax=Saccharothrix sp. S26 TaxID=2907215 RepID=UPI001F338B67|nr:hypothetical protein [Saccharothrix sp. S26]MCE6998516.1 hypothetical protein [Saccharothrix sp. S26]
MTTSDDPAVSPAVRRSELGSVTSREELARLLAEQYARADVSLRELELRAERAGGPRLARATCSDMLAGRRFPKKSVMVAFLRACQVPREQLADWERAWERIKITQISTARASAAGRQAVPTPDRSPSAPEDGGSGEGGAEDAVTMTGQKAQPAGSKPGRGRDPARRRLALPAALAAAGLVAAIGFAAFTDSGTPAQRDIIDDGRAFGSGGSSRFVVTVDPVNTEVRLIRRLDAGIARQTATVTVDGALAAVWQPLPEGPHGWKDQSVVLPPALTQGRRELTITNTFVSSDVDFNEFTYFVDHRVDGVWSRADTVDVGPNHLDSEAVHHYRITNENWSGTHAFRYLE